MKKPVLKAAAVVTIRGAAKMNADGRKAVATWLRRHANDLVKYGSQYDGNFQGRYLYRRGR